MDVNSVNKPAVQPAPAPKRAEARPPAPVRENNQSQETEVRKAAQAQQNNKPVVNTQGQVTGRRLNVTA